MTKSDSLAALSHGHEGHEEHKWLIGAFIFFQLVLILAMYSI